MSNYTLIVNSTSRLDGDTSTMNRQYITLFNAIDKALNRGVEIQYKLTNGGIEDYVEQNGFKKALEMIKGL